MIKIIKSRIINKTLGDMPIGSIVKIPENGVPTNYIIVQKGKPSDLYDDSCDGVWLLREQAHSKSAWEGVDISVCRNDYRVSFIKTWLNNEFLNTIDSKIRAEIKVAKIPYRRGFGRSRAVQSGANGLACKVFLLSGYEVGFTTTNSSYLPVDGTKLSYFYYDYNNSRICKDSTDTTVGWWLRSPDTYDIASVFHVHEFGSLSSNYSYYPCVAVRPAFILPPNLSVTDNGTIVVTSATQSSKQLADIPRGETFRHCGHEWLVLEHRDDNSTFVLLKNTIGRMPFDENDSNNWERSSLRKYLNGKFLTRMCGEKSPSNLGFMSFATDLTADDGRKDYGQSIDTVSLLTCDLYREHRDILNPFAEWWWLATPYSTIAANSYNVHYVYTDGTLNYYHAYSESRGVRPVCCLNSDIIVDIVGRNKNA